MSDGHDSPRGTGTHVAQHMAGLSAAAALAGLCYAAYDWMPWLLGGTTFEALRVLASVAAAFAILSIGHAAADWITTRRRGQQ